MKSQIYKIVEEKNEIDDHLLDIIGNEFKFDHQKGISEWIKNAADAYIRAGVSDGEQHLILNFNDSVSGNATMECIDFVGMTILDITKAFKRWGDPEAAKRGLKKRTYGGHGNGGKFYMRQMFKQSYFITYRDGRLNVFGFSPNKKYGFAEGYKNISMSPDEALKYSGLDLLPVPQKVLDKIRKGKTGFTVVRGITPQGMPNILQVSKICEHLRNHAQARKLFERMYVSIVYNNREVAERLLPDQLEPKEGFEQPFYFEIPDVLEYVEKGENHKVQMANSKFQRGKLTLKTSQEALERTGRYGDLNRIDIVGEIGVIASYQIYELGSGMYPQSVFIYGECECPILEDESDDCVKNDRSKLIAENPKTKALLFWIGNRVNEVADKIAEKEKQEQKQLVREYSQAYNDFLNKWSAKFLNKIRSEVLIGPGFGPGAGVGEGGDSGGKGGGKNNGDGGNGLGHGDNPGGGDTPKSRPRNPKVLLSEMNEDPLNPGHVLHLDPRQGVIYQRFPGDVQEGIYWINTSSPLAKSIIETFGEKSQQWRSYLFQRYIDIFVKEEMRNLFKRDSEMFNPDYIDTRIFGEFVTKVYEVASQDLRAFLLDDSFGLI